MTDRLNAIGAITAIVVFASSIITFTFRLLFRISPGHWIGTPLLLMVFPLGYLLITAPRANRPFLYYIQVGLMLVWIISLFLIDYIFKYNFRQTQWMVISYVVFYFAAMGGMIGVASLAGRFWSIASIVLFFVALILAFVQRAITGI